MDKDTLAFNLFYFVEGILNNPYIKNKPTDKQAEFLMHLDISEGFYGGAAGGGKLLDVSTRIFTTNGFKTIGSIEIGDIVFDEKGKQCTVIAVSDIEFDRECYAIHFSDGSEITAADDHLWPAVSINEETKLTRRTDEYREKRKLNRKKRGTGKRPDLEKSNSNREYQYLDKPTIQNKTTTELYKNQTIRGRSNYYIPVCKPLRFNKKEFILDPYILGVWLGDGSRNSSIITGIDNEIFEEIEKRGHTVNHHSNDKSHSVHGLITLIKQIGCYKNKHIPTKYFHGSVKQRLDLLKGLMDTDGTVTKNGACEIILTDEILIYDISQLLHSLGIKHQVREGIAKLNGKEISKKWRIKFYTNLKVFNLSRKYKLQKRINLRKTVFRRYIIKIEPVESVPVRCIQVTSESGQYVISDACIPTHNSDALLMAALQFANIQGYAALLLRRTYADLSLPGALMDRAFEWLDPTDAKWNDKSKTWHFPGGGSLTFGYLETERDKFRYQSSEFQFIGFDELTQFTETQFRYLFSRARRLKDIEIPIRIRAASNPGGVGHEWVKNRYITLTQNELRKEERYFVPALLEDNPFLDAVAYRDSLTKLDPVTRQQLESGDWDVSVSGGMFKRQWFELVNGVPHSSQVRYWDLAATEAREDTDPDYTVGALLVHKEGTFYIKDIRRIRASPGEVEKLILQTAQLDDPGTLIYMEQEPGSSGINTIDHYARRVLVGYPFYSEKVTGSKTIRAQPLSAAASHGNVKILSRPWVSDLLNEMELFPESVHDDQVDAVSGAFNVLAGSYANYKGMGLPKSQSLPGFKKSSGIPSF